MAKGLRSSKIKANRAGLRSTVFGPTERARKERLSAKLLEIAAKPKPSATENKDTAVEETVEDVAARQEMRTETEANSFNPHQDMDIDETTTAIRPTARSKSTSRGRIQKRGRGKAGAAMVFPVYKRGRVSGIRKRQKGSSCYAG